MAQLLTAADGLLRGRWRAKEELGAGRISTSAGLLAAIGLAAGAIYGCSMGLYGLLRPGHATWKQVLADAAKVPLLFLLTLVVAFPSLYAFSALANSKLRFGDTLKLLLVAVAVNLVLLASFAPVTAFFTVSTNSYPFMVLLNCVFFGLSGAIGLGILRRALNEVFASGSIGRCPEAAPAGADAESVRRAEAARSEWARARSEGNRPRRIFAAWFAIYGLVGSQMGWILRPFIGSPGLEFQLFRPREGSFFEGFFRALGQFLLGS